MTRLKNLTVVALVLVMVLFGLQVAAQAKSHYMTGEIAAIDRAYKTVVVEVPLGQETFTVGGPLAPDAVLKKGAKSVSLDDFAVGDKVTVKWRSTEKGHVIERLVGK